MRLADLQHGCVHRQQLDAAGVRKDAVLRRIAKGHLRRVHSDVFSVRMSAHAALAAEMAAALHFRGDAVVSGATAAAIWKIADDPPGDIEVTLVGRNAEPQPGIRIHRAPTLDATDIRWRHGIPLTAPARTLIDLAATATQLELENAIAEARRRRLATESQIGAALKRAGNRAGVAALAAILKQLEATRASPSRTRSLYERRLLRLIEAAALPKPVTNIPIQGHEVDMFWPAHRLVVEFDGFAFHSDRHAFERDRLRDQKLVAAGLRVIRITQRQIDHEPLAVVARLAQALMNGVQSAADGML